MLTPFVTALVFGNCFVGACLVVGAAFAFPPRMAGGFLAGDNAVR